MKILDQLTKELQALVEKPEMNEIIEQKMGDAFHEGRMEATAESYMRWKKAGERQIAGLLPEERKRLENGHVWGDGAYEGDSECMRCGIDYNDMFEFPQFCDPREKKEGAS